MGGERREGSDELIDSFRELSLFGTKLAQLLADLPKFNFPAFLLVRYCHRCLAPYSWYIVGSASPQVAYY